MHPLRREQRELQLQLGGLGVVVGDEGIDHVAGDLCAGRRHGGAGAAEHQRDQQHLHGGEIAGVAGAVDLDDQPRDAREVARALLDEGDARQLGKRDGVGNGDVGAGAGIEIKRDRQARLARDRLEIGDEVVARRWAGEGPQRRQDLERGRAAPFGILRERDGGLERGMGDADHHRHTAGDEVDSAVDQGLARLEAEIGVFLRLDAGGDHHGGGAVFDHVIDLAAQRGVVDREVGREGRERGDDETGSVGGHRYRSTSFQPSGVSRCWGRKRPL